MKQSLYRRPLPEGLIPFGSAEGRGLFREALEAGTLEGFFALAEQFHTQSEPSFCGLGSLVMALNALAIDPGRLWKGPWRWFSEELLDCCAPLDRMREHGLSLEELACLARCNGAGATVMGSDSHDLGVFRQTLREASESQGEPVVIVSYSRKVLGQTGEGHFSPVAGYHAGRDLALILDVARFKYPPHWVKVGDLYAATQQLDPATGRPRGWVVLKRFGRPSSLVYFVSCKGVGWLVFTQRLLDQASLDLAQARVESVREALGVFLRAAREAGIADVFSTRPVEHSEHATQATALRAVLRSTSIYSLIEATIGPELAEIATVLVLALPDEIWKPLPDPIRRELAAWLNLARNQPDLANEIAHVSLQLAELRTSQLGPAFERSSALDCASCASKPGDSPG